MTNYQGQAQQDKFVVHMTQKKKNGYFLEIGSNDPVAINNTYVLEKEYGWKGIMIDIRDSWLWKWEEERPNSTYIIQDATQIDYSNLFSLHNVPSCIDYLQIDLDVTTGSTLATLKKLDAEVMDNHKFATITFEHDIYDTNKDNTRLESREIFKKRGYQRIFSDVNNQGICPFEDWYVHPDLIDSELIAKVITRNKRHYKVGVERTNFFDESPVHTSINWEDIDYDDI